MHKLIFLCLSLCVSVPSVANTRDFSTPKPTGISLEWYQHELDMDVTHIYTNIPGIPATALNNIKSRLNTSDQTSLLNLRLDHQIQPYLNVFGAVGKITNTSRVNFSGLGLGTSDLTANNEGTAYTLGATLSAQRGSWIATLKALHSTIDLDNSAGNIRVNALFPSLGVQTDHGTFSTSLIYQAIEASYYGTVDVPLLGAVPTSVDVKNNDKIQITLGWTNEVSKDLYLDANVGLNGQEQFQLQLNKRF